MKMKILLVKSALLLGTLLLALPIPVLAAANPYDWFEQNGTDPLNYEATGPNGDYVTVSNLLGTQGWSAQGANMSDQNAAVSAPGQYVRQDNKLAIGDTYCGTPGCRNHSRVWGIPSANSTDSISGASTEHYPGGFTHYVDSFNDGRDGVYNMLWQTGWVTSGYYYQQYGGGCTPQPDGTCAPYDGQVAYQAMQAPGGAAPNVPNAVTYLVRGGATHFAQSCDGSVLRETAVLALRFRLGVGEPRTAVAA